MRRHRFHRWGSRVLMLDSAYKKVGGVCAGLARYLGISRFFVRLAALIGLCLAPRAILIAYGLAYFILDDDAGLTNTSNDQEF